jgi:hypothetical protein
MGERLTCEGENATIRYLLGRADHCRRLAQRADDADDVAELLRLADLFTSTALRLATGEPATRPRPSH